MTSAILEHHERLDGSGYPRGKRGEEISVGARIVTAAGAFDAMTHPRPHRPAMSPDEALDTLSAQGKTGAADKEIVRTLVRLV